MELLTIPRCFPTMGRVPAAIIDSGGGTFERQLSRAIAALQAQTNTES